MESYLTIQFGKSNSKIFEKVVKLAARDEGYSLENNMHKITFSREKLMLKWDNFYKIYGLTCNWKSFSLFINNNQIQPDKVNRVVHEIRDVVGCFSAYMVYQQKSLYCDRNPFGCVNIKSINLNPEGYGSFWYLYGHFEEDATRWIIHKKEIEIIIKEEIERKQLHFCPVFTTDKISQVIASFPDYIDMVKEKGNWVIIYEKRFVGAKVVDIPKSIRHILNSKDEPVEEELPIVDDMEDVNPFKAGTDDWANWEIENYLKKNLPHNMKRQ